MKKALQIFSFTVIALFILSLFGWMASHLTKGDKDFGFLNGPVEFMMTFPDMFNKSVEQVKSLPETFIKTPEGFEPVNRLDSNLTVLTTYSLDNTTRAIDLVNLKNDSVLHRWTVDNPHLITERIKNPLLLPGKHLIFSYQGKALQRIDSLSNRIWIKNDVWAHHAMNFDSDSNIWTCAYAPVYHATGIYKLEGKTMFYIDNYISKIDPETGEVLFNKSITEILVENGLEGYILKSTNVKDPLHLNDVEPALKTTRYFNKHDVFISLRQPSLIIHYRPSTNKVIDIIEGPFISQHDVDIYNDNTLMIFNNNYYTITAGEGKAPPKDSSRLAEAGDFYSNIIRYDFTNDSISFVGDSVFRANQIFSRTEGLMDFIDPFTYFVEEQNTGLIWVIRNDSVVYKNVFKSQHKGYHHLPNWTRIVKNYE